MQYPVLVHRDGTGRYEAVSLTMNPWLRMAGMFKDDPALEEMLEEIYALCPAPDSENMRKSGRDHEDTPNFTTGEPCSQPT